MTNNERFNAMINSCENPREALRAAAPIIRSTRSSSSYPQEGDNVAALTARLNACKHRRKIFNALVAIANSKDHPAPSLCSRPAQAGIHPKAHGLR